MLLLRELEETRIDSVVINNTTIFHIVCNEDRFPSSRRKDRFLLPSSRPSVDSAS